MKFLQAFSRLTKDWRFSLFLGALLLASSCLKAQPGEGRFDYDRLSEVKISQMLRTFEIDSLSDFNAIKTRCYNAADSSTYRSHTKSYTFDAPMAQVWESYMTAPPHVAWQCLMVDYAFSFAERQGTICHNGDTFTGLEEGQLHFLNLNFLGFFKLAVGHKVTRIDEQNKSIKFCYLENGASQGSQWIRMKVLKDGTTQVTHFTRFKSSSQFRDKNLYPTLHTLIINAFHHNIKRNLRRRMRKIEQNKTRQL